jgi:hypothetical protein
MIILVPFTSFSQGYLGKTSNSVFGIAKDILSTFNPDGSMTGEARSKILRELSILYGSNDNPLDTEEVKRRILTDNLPVVSLLNKQSFNDYASSFKFASRGVLPSFIVILENLIVDKTSSAAKETMFTLVLKNIFANQEMAILFPKTQNFFNTFTKYDLKASPRIFTETFKSDFKQIPFNLSKIFVEIKKYRDTLDQYPHLKIYMEANRYYREIKNLKPVEQINHKTLNYLSVNNNVHSELYNSLKLMQYFYFQFKNESKSSFSKSAFLECITELKENPSLQDLYLGLVCAQNPDIEFALNKGTNNPLSGGETGEAVQIVTMTPIINMLKKNHSYNKIIDYLYNYAEKYDAMTTLSDSINSLREYDEPVTDEMRDLYFEKTIDFLRYSLDPSNIYPEGKFDKSEINLFIEIINKYKSLEHNIDDGENLAALMNTYYIYGDLCKTHSAFGKIYEGVSGDFLKYISITADILSAKSDEEIAKIANDYVFSNTDANAKKQSDFSLLLNAYGGVYYGKEAPDVTNNWTRNRGVIAPIGIELAKGFKDFGNLSLFVPFFDLGAVIDFKPSGDSSETIPNLDINNIISMGMYLTYGFPKIPLSVGGGFQFSPNLGTITTNGKTIEPRKLRWNLYLAFDLPLLKIF